MSELTEQEAKQISNELAGFISLLNNAFGYNVYSVEPKKIGVDANGKDVISYELKASIKL